MKKIIYSISYCFFFLMSILVQAQPPAVHIPRQKAALMQVGTTSTTFEATAALQVDDNARGILIPRMNSTERDAITAPANALLIFNTSNNTFEVYKTSCTCWVTVSDGGNTPAQSLVNTAPTANSVNYTGDFRVGGTVNIVYTYADAQSDPEGATTIQWQSANDNLGAGLTNIGTGASFTLTAAHSGLFIRAIVTPRATTGILNGTAVTSAYNQVNGTTVPFATAISVTGTPAQGSTLTGAYTYDGGTPPFVEYTNPLDAFDRSLYTWQTATSSEGAGILTATLPTNQTLHRATYIPTNADAGRFIRFGVRARNTNSLTANGFVFSSWVGPLEFATEQAPVAQNVQVPAPATNVILTGSYTYFDANGDPEGTSTYQWYNATDVAGTGQTAITGATSINYTVTAADAGKFIGLGVTPKALTGTLTGAEVIAYNAAASIGAADFTFTGVNSASNNYTSGRVMNSTNTLTVQVDVITAGSIIFSTNTVDGYSFSTSGTYPTGTQNITLVATGTKASFNASGDTFTITGVANTSPTTTFTVINQKLGFDYTTHFNGITSEINSNFNSISYTGGETFNNNSTTAASIISAGYTTTTCTGSITGVSGRVYNLLHINGQCWLDKNSNEIPTNFPTSPTWLATSPGDIGSWGYYHTTVTTGASGWQATEPATNEGLLYQWSAAMNGSSAERAQGVCPNGFHVPSEAEWMYLEHGLGMSLTQQQTTGNRSASNDNQGTPGNKLRSQGVGFNNLSTFSGMLGGYRNTAGNYLVRATNGHWWTSTLSTATNASSRALVSNMRGVNRISNNRAMGYSVRCLKD